MIVDSERNAVILSVHALM